MLKNAIGWINQDRLGSIGKFFPYGQERPSATTNGNEKFATYTRDAETGLDYAQNRYESSGDGRFLTADPKSGSARRDDPGSWNKYAYVGGDPANRADPTGLDYIDVQSEPAGWFSAHMDQLGSIGNDPQCMILMMSGQADPSQIAYCTGQPPT